MNNKAEFEYYINVTERESNLFKINGENYKEKIAMGAYDESLSKYGNVPVLLNHDHNKVIADKNDVELFEDNLGLVAIFKTDNAEVINKIVNNEISGCSFGFVPIAYTDIQKKGYIQRTVSELELTEVSLLDKSKIPVYKGNGLYRKKIPYELEQRIYECKTNKIDYKEYEDKIKALREIDYKRYEDRIKELKKLGLRNHYKKYEDIINSYDR